MSALGQLDTLSQVIGQITGEEIRSRIMVGRERIKPAVKPEVLIDR